MLTRWRGPADFAHQKPGRRQMSARKESMVRVFGLDAGDWSLLILGIALASLLMVLI